MRTQKNYAESEVFMQELIYQGKKYTRNRAKWTDSNHMTVHETLQAELNKKYAENLNFSALDTKTLVEEGDKCKEGETYDVAVAFYEEAVKSADEITLQYVLPRITSCYRRMNTPRKAVKLFTIAKEKYGEEFLTPVLLTSVAAAYCDLQEYENALRCCKWAYKRYNGEPPPELYNVFLRIKNESETEVPYFH